MRAALLFCILAVCAVAVVSGQVATSTTTTGSTVAATVAVNTVEPAASVDAVDTYTPAIMTKPSASLKKPIIFAPKAVAGTPEADAPIVGTPPANLKKSVVTEHIYGGSVEFVKGRTPQGCRCKKQMPEKFRYDTELRDPRVKPTPCGCHKKGKKHNKGTKKLPPVVAALYPERGNATHFFNGTARFTPCLKTVLPPVTVEKIAPSYYAKGQGPSARARRRALIAAGKKGHKAPCAKPLAAPAPTTVTPSFYPARSERKLTKSEAKKARKAAKHQKKAARKAARAAKKAARKAARAAKKAAKAAKKF